MLKVALIQNIVSSCKANNLSEIESKIKLVSDKGVQLVCLPEYFNCPFGSKNFISQSENIPNGETCKMLSNVSKKCGIWIVGGSIPEIRENRIYNSSMVFDPNGQLIGLYSKMHLFDSNRPVYKESETSYAGNEFFSFNVPVCKNINVTVGVGICHDLRFPEVARIYTRHKNCNLLLYSAAFNMATGPAYWELLGRGIALDNQCYVGLCSIARDYEAFHVSYGHSLASDPWGRVIDSLNEQIMDTQGNHEEYTMSDIEETVERIEKNCDYATMILNFKSRRICHVMEGIAGSPDRNY